MAHWLMKSEPGSYSWDQLQRDRSTEWDGVRNPAARLHLKAMKAGDEAFFYHSGDERQIVGVMRVTREAPEPDGRDVFTIELPTGRRATVRVTHDFWERIPEDDIPGRLKLWYLDRAVAAREVVTVTSAGLEPAATSCARCRQTIVVPADIPDPVFCTSCEP